MKKPLLTALAAAFMLQARAQTFSHAPVPVTGFTADVIADGTGPASNSTTDNVDGGNYNLVAQNYVSPSNQTPSAFLPTGGLINSIATPGLMFQLAPYAGNNSLRLTATTSTGTLTFTTPRAADKISLLVTSAYSATFTATINFSDGTNQAYANNTVPNWYDGASPAIQGIGRVQRVTNALENPANNPRLYQFSFALSAANAAKTIQSITITRTSTATNEIIHVFAVSAGMAIANDAGVSAISAPVSPVVPGTSQPVSVTVKNYGSAPLTAATLGFSVNGTTVLNNYAFTASPGLATNAVSAPVTIGNYSFPAGIHTVKAWSKLPNGAVDGMALNDTVQMTLFSCNALSGNYTINKNLAASATNFTSFNNALQMLASCGVSGPVTFSVAPNTGPYNEQVILPVISGTTATNTVTFEGNGNTITAPTTASNQGVFRFNGADFVKVNNFIINITTATPAGYGIQFTNASDFNTISNCTINLPLTSTSDVYNGIVAGVNTSTVGNNANNVLIQNNIINGGYYGVFIQGTATTSGNRIIGNQIKDSHVYGVNLTSGGTGTIVEGNDISRPARANAGVMYGIFLSGSTTNTIINKNRIHDTHTAAGNTANTVWAIYTTAAATPGNENIIKNNLLYNINNAGAFYSAFYNTDGSGTYYYHNTVSANNPNITFTNLRALHLSGTATNVKFINNIVSLTSPATNKHTMYVTTAATALTSNGNDLYVGSAGNIGYFGSDQATLAAWKLVGGSAFDQNSISVDPVFANPSGNLRPLAAALDNAGRALPAVTDDFYGVTRSATAPDMGAIEFIPAVNDAGIAAVVAPTTPVTPGSQAVTVTLKNFGTASLTSAIIGWKVNNTNQPDVNWSGNLNTFQTSATPINLGNYNFAAGTHTIKVWSKMPNGAPDLVPANDTITVKLIACGPMAGSYTINKNNPTLGTNFNTISDAVMQLTSCGVNGPVTITVAPNSGPYNEQVEIQNIPNTSATNTVTVEGSGNTVSTSPIGKPGIFVLNGAKYVKLNNFVLTLAPGATVGCGVQLITGADYNTVSNSTINLPISSTALDVNGILSGNSTTLAGNHAAYCKFQNNFINGGYHGIRLNGLSTNTNPSNNEITGNQFKDSYNYGVYVSNMHGTLIEGNDISRPTRTNGTSFTGIYLASGTCMNTVISKNRIHNTHDVATATNGIVQGIYINASTSSGAENIVKNNLIYNLNNAGGTVHGMFNSAGNGVWYYHNTIVTDGITNYNTLRGITLNTAVSNIKIINNLISLPSPATTNKYLIYVTGTPTGSNFISDNNVLYPGTTGMIGYYGIDRVTFADWKLANFDVTGASADPVFANAAAGNLKPTSGAVDNIGQALTAVPTDILGVTRSLTTPDAGAYEFSPATDDAGITDVSGPSNSTCNISAAEDITVTIKNYGTSTLTNIPVSYKVNNGAPVNETWTGSLASNATASYTFTTKANLATPGTFKIVAKTLLTTDAVITNNADSLEIMNPLMNSNPVKLDFETAATGISRFRKIDKANSNITESTAASYGTTSTKGLIMDGVMNPGWLAPTGVTNPWTVNPDHLGAVYFCITPASMGFTNSMWLNFDLKQLYKTANVNTNFRVTVNGTQVGPTYRPPFSGTPIDWQKVSVDLTSYKNQPYVLIGLESSVKEEYTNGNGTANLIDNITFDAVSKLGVKDNILASQLHVFPNPSAGNFMVSLPQGKTYQLEVTDLTGKHIQSLQAKGDTQLNLENAAKGIYLLKVSGENGTAVRKLVIE